MSTGLLYNAAALWQHSSRQPSPHELVLLERSTVTGDESAFLAHLFFFYFIIVETGLFLLDYHSHALCHCLLQPIHPATLSSPCLSVLSFASLNARYIKSALFAPFLSFQTQFSPAWKALWVWAWISHGWIFTNPSRQTWKLCNEAGTRRCNQMQNHTASTLLIFARA